MDNPQQTIKRLESFLEDYTREGICGFTLLDDEKGIQVIVILDLDWVQSIMTKPGFVAKRIRDGIQSEIKKWLGLDIYVGSTAIKCDKEIKESNKKDYLITQSQLGKLIEIHNTRS